MTRGERVGHRDPGCGCILAGLDVGAYDVSIDRSACTSSGEVPERWARQLAWQGQRVAALSAELAHTTAELEAAKAELAIAQRVKGPLK